MKKYTKWILKRETLESAKEPECKHAIIEWLRTILSSTDNLEETRAKTKHCKIEIWKIELLESTNSIWKPRKENQYLWIKITIDSQNNEFLLPWKNTYIIPLNWLPYCISQKQDDKKWNYSNGINTFYLEPNEYLYLLWLITRNSDTNILNYIKNNYENILVANDLVYLKEDIEMNIVTLELNIDWIKTQIIINWEDIKIFVYDSIEKKYIEIKNNKEIKRFINYTLEKATWKAKEYLDKNQEKINSYINNL